MRGRPAAHPHAHDLNAAVAACVPAAFQDHLERVPYSWSVNNFDVDGGILVAAGWALPIGGDPEMTEFLVDDEPARPVERNGVPTLRERYPYWPNADESGFVLRVPKETWTQRAAAGVELSIRHRASGLELDAYARWHLPIRGAEQSPIPPDELRSRIGHMPDRMFLLTGYSLYRNFDRACREWFGRGLQEFPTILDWGCGCGRVARHVLPDRPSGSRLIGVDIDEEALQWCREHLPDGEFRRVPSLPPSGLPPQSLDLVYAYSVVTHLDEKTQDRWLEELHRIAKPGAPVLLTVLSERALVELNPTVDRRWLARWRRAGIDWASRNTGLDAILGENEYYRNTYHTPRYIRSRWARWFEVLGFIESFHYYQSLAVLRAR